MGKARKFRKAKCSRVAANTATAKCIHSHLGVQEIARDGKIELVLKKMETMFAENTLEMACVSKESSVYRLFRFFRVILGQSFMKNTKLVEKNEQKGQFTCFKEKKMKKKQ